MLMLEETEGLLVPVLLPVAGTYDRYGRIDHSAGEHAEWIDCLLELWWEAGTLCSTYPDGLDHERGLTGPAVHILGHAADSVFNRFTLELMGRKVHPCLYRNDVAREIIASSENWPNLEEQNMCSRSPMVYADWLEELGRPIQAAYQRRQHELGETGLLGQLSEATQEVADRFACILRYAEKRGGLRPINSEDADQHSYQDMDRFAQDAWDSGDPILCRMLKEWHDHDLLADEEALPFHESARERACAANPVGLNAIAEVLGKQWDPAVVVVPAVVAEIVSAIEGAADQERVLRILQAIRPPDAEQLAEFDGLIAIHDETLTITCERFPNLDPSEYVIKGKQVQVANGARVAAGDPLTKGAQDIHQTMRIFGEQCVIDRLVDELQPLLEITPERLLYLVEPMTQLILITNSHHRVSRPMWERWFEEGVLTNRGIRAEPVVTSYATLADHVDPSFDEVLAEATRRDDLPCELDKDSYRMSIRL